MRPPLICCSSLRSASMIIAIIQTIMAVAYGIVLIAFIIIVAIQSRIQKKNGGDIDTTTASNTTDADPIPHVDAVDLAVLTVLLASKVVKFIIATMLLQGAKEKRLSLCKIWFVVTCILVVLSIGNFVYRLTTRDTTSYLQIAVAAINFTSSFYFIWIVCAFMSQLKSIRPSKPYKTSKSEAEHPQPKV